MCNSRYGGRSEKKRKLQLLISSVGNDPSSLLDSLNPWCDSIVINQCDNSESRQLTWNGFEVCWFNFRERGIGRSRNEALLRADAEYVLFCDEDCSYTEDTQAIILQGFEDNKDADILLFDLEPHNCGSGRHPLRITESKVVGRFSYMKYGAVHVAARLSALRKTNVGFNLLFGGGSVYSCGEDTIFLKDCLDKGLVIKTCPQTIGSVDFTSSSWFNGYNEKYFLSRGALHRRVAGKWHWAVSLRFFLRLRKSIPRIDRLKCFKALFSGADEFSRL